MGFKGLFKRKKDQEILEENIPEVAPPPAAPEEPKERVRVEINIPDNVFKVWSSAIFEEKILDAIKAIDWKNPSIEDLTALIRNSINCLNSATNEQVKISFIKYMTSVILEQYTNYNDLLNEFSDSRDAKFKEFMITLIQTLADICTIFGIDFYTLFLAINRIPIYYERKDNITIEHYFNYSFRYFSKLWENSKSRFLLDRRENHIRVYEDVMSSFFEEFLENAEPIDIEAIYKFSIQNEEIIETDFSKLLVDTIENGYYEPKVFIKKDTVLAIVRHYPYLLIDSYINRFNSVISEMQSAREENDVDRISEIDDEMQQLIKTISDYQEYRSEDFSEYFKNTWEWFLGEFVFVFSGITLDVFADFLINTIKIPEDVINEEIFSSVLFLFVGLEYNQENVLNPYTFAEAYRLLTSEVAFEAIDLLNPNLVKAF